MAAKKSAAANKAGGAPTSAKISKKDLAGIDAATAISALRRLGTAGMRDGLARYAIPSERAFGVSMKDVQALAKRIGRDHALAAALWDSGWYDARMLAIYIDDPALVTSTQMEAWCRDFDNWAHCDTACFALFDRTPLAWAKIRSWAKRRGEFQRRAAFALLASVALHDKQADDAIFIAHLPLAEAAADDERNFVKKAVSWALRGIGKRGPKPRAEAIAVALRLAASAEKAPRWVGKDVLRELQRAGKTKA